MAEQASAQTRLDKLVAVIAANMVAEVCSIYLRRAGKALELFATEGLNPAAVHRTRMQEGEGLVGLVAETAEADESQRRARPSAFLLSPGNRRRSFPLVPRRAHRPRRPGLRRAHGAEPSRAPLRRRGSRSATDRRDGAGRSRRARRDCSTSPNSTSRNCASTGHWFSRRGVVGRRRGRSGRVARTARQGRTA